VVSAMKYRIDFIIRISNLSRRCFKKYIVLCHGKANQAKSGELVRCAWDGLFQRFRTERETTECTDFTDGCGKVGPDLRAGRKSDYKLRNTLKHEKGSSGKQWDLEGAVPPAPVA